MREETDLKVMHLLSYSPVLEKSDIEAGLQSLRVKDGGGFPVPPLRGFELYHLCLSRWLSLKGFVFHSWCVKLWSSIKVLFKLIK